MDNIVLYISIYTFPWLHVLRDLSPINNDRKHAISTIFISVFFGNNIFVWVFCLNIFSYPHNASMKMTLRIWAVNILSFTPT